MTPCFVLIRPILAACSQPVPKWREVERVERALAADACAGALGRWDRKYFYAVDRRASSERATSRVRFTLDEAGVGDRGAGRRVGDVEPFLTYDHRQRRLASGVYDLRTGKLDVEHCGHACGPKTPVGGSCG